MNTFLIYIWTVISMSIIVPCWLTIVEKNHFTLIESLSLTPYKLLYIQRNSFGKICVFLLTILLFSGFLFFATILFMIKVTIWLYQAGLKDG